MDILTKIEVKINEFDNIRKILMSDYSEKNKEYTKNRESYDGYLSRTFEFLELAGFSPKISGKDIYMKLEDVFIPLHIDSHNQPSFIKGKEQDKQYSIENILEQRDLVVLGDPGSGKSTLLKYIATFVSQNRSNDWLYKDTVPIFIKISEYADWYEKNHKNLYEYIISTDSQYSELFKENFEYSNLLVLLDGLDEITDSAIRNNIVKNIIDLKSRFPYNRYIITSRLIGYRESSLSGHFKESRLKDFTINDIKLFAKQWYKSIATNEINSKENLTNIEKTTTLSKYETLATELYNSISRNSSVLKFAKNPLLMTIVAMIFYQSKKLPNKRVELYDIATETFLDNWVRARFKENSKFKDKGTILEILPQIAFKIHSESNKGLIDESGFKDEFINIYQEVNGSTLLEAKKEFIDFKDFLEKYTGFFYRKDIEGDKYGFVHLTFEEYLSGLELKSKWELNELGITGLSKYIFDPRWVEVIRLAVAKLKISNQGKSGRVKATQFINDILSSYDEFPESYRPLQLVLLIMADDVEINNQAKIYIVDKFIEVLNLSEHKVLVSSFENIFTELLYSIYCDDFIKAILKELENNNELFVKNCIRIMLSNSVNSTIYDILKSILDNDQINIYLFQGIESYIRDKPKTSVAFLEESSLIEKYREYLIKCLNEEIVNSNINFVFYIYLKLLNIEMLSDNSKKIIMCFNQESNDKVKVLFYYLLLQQYYHNDYTELDSEQIIDQVYQHKILTACDIISKCDHDFENHKSVSFKAKHILVKTDNKKIIIDLELLKVIDIKDSKKTNALTEKYTDKEKEEFEGFINLLNGDKCCKKNIDYFINTYYSKDTLLDFFGWEEFLFKNLQKSPEKLSKILLQNISTYERERMSKNKDFIKEKILDKRFFNNLIPPIRLFLLRLSNEPYDKELISDSLKYFYLTKDKKEKMGVFYILYKTTNPFTYK